MSKHRAQMDLRHGFLLIVVLPAALICLFNTAFADGDTLQVVSTAIEPGDTGSVFIYIANSEDLGGYTIRLEFDPTWISPVRKTPGNSVIESEQIRGNFSVFTFNERSPGVITGAAVPFSSSESLYPGRSVAIKLLFEARYDAPIGSVVSLVFASDPEEPDAHNLFSELNGLYVIYPELVSGTVTIGQTSVLRVFCPQDLQVNCGDPTNPFYTGEAYANEQSAEITYSDDQVPGSCTGELTITRTWTAVLGTAEKSCTQLIAVVDHTPPELSCPEDFTIGFGESYEPNVTGFAFAEDNCGDIPVISHVDDEIPGHGLINRTIIRTWQAVDVCGNIAECTQPITELAYNVEFAIYCSDDITISCDQSTDPENTGRATAAYTQSLVTYSDITIDGSCPNEFRIRRLWTASLDGTEDSCTQIISVVDNDAPTITCPPPAQAVSVDDAIPSNTGYPEVTDNCNESVQVTFEDQVDTTTADSNWTITRTWIATDHCGNTSSCAQQINKGTGDGLESVGYGPNPFYSGDGRETCFTITLPQPGPLSISMFDVVGRRMKTIALDNGAAGTNQMCWDGRDADGHFVPSGVYLCLLEYGGKSETIKLAVIRQ
jgi:hypothetical protein